MSDALSLAEIDGQHAELLPPRTVLSVFLRSNTGGSYEEAPMGPSTAPVVVDLLSPGAVNDLDPPL